jgi:hypothetical protein
MANFPHDPDYDGGTDADHLPIIFANNFPPEASHGDESPPLHPALGDLDKTKV